MAFSVPIHALERGRHPCDAGAGMALAGTVGAS